MLPGRALLNKCSQKKLVMWTSATTSFALKSKSSAPRVQRALDKWWRVALNSFGPPFTKHTPQYIKLGLKFRGNEDRREAFRRDCEAQICQLGLQVPKLYRRTYPFI
jgi:1,2-phenylacetyl-CoA epoxidase catalytic subunit